MNKLIYGIIPAIRKQGFTLPIEKGVWRWEVTGSKRREQS